MTPFSHLLLFTYGLYMTTATLLNGHLYTDGFIIALNLCIPMLMFRLTALFALSCQETFVLKRCMLLSSVTYIQTHYRLLLVIWK